MHSKFPYIEDLYFYKITHFHAVFFIKIIDFKAYLLLKVVIHIFLLEPNILKLNRGKNPREMSPVFLNIPPKSKIKPISYPESSGFLVSGATPGRLWGHRILLPQDFCGKTMETVTEQPIKKIEFFRCPQSLPGVAPLTKKPEDSGYEIEIKRSFPRACSGISADQNGLVRAQSTQSE